MTKRASFKCFHSSPGIFRMAIVMYVRFFPLSVRNVEYLLPERGVDVSHETVRYWWNGFGPKLPLNSALNVSKKCMPTRIGSGIWTRLS